MKLLCELIRISISYYKAVEYAKSVSSDDIKEEKIKFDNKTGIGYLKEQL